MADLKPVRWREGLFLRPQHFQQQDRYWAACDQLKAKAYHHFEWGLVDVELNEDALNNFTLEVRRLRAVLRDGSFVDVPGNARPMYRDFEDRMSEIGKPLDVSFGVRARGERGPETSDGERGTEDRRYIADQEDVYDLDRDGDAVSFERLNFNLRLFFGDEPTDGYTIIPFARLLRQGDSSHPVIPDPDYSPPCLVLACSPVLMRIAREIFEHLILAVRALGDQRGGADPLPMVQYYGLAGHIPVLRDMLVEGRCHPREMYHELARVAGAMFFGDPMGGGPEDVPTYSHVDPARTFLALKELIVNRLVRPITTKDWDSLPMTRAGDEFTTNIPADALKPGTQYYIEILSAGSAGQVPSLMMRARIGLPERLDHLKANALIGVPREIMPAAPPKLPPGQTGTFFRMKHESNEWVQHVGSSGQLGVSISGAPEDIEVRLILVSS
jgi:type VI secretion system protein ImpJ